MKLILKYVILTILITSSTFGAFSQQTLTAQHWQEDLRYLHKTVHARYPFLFKKISKEAWDAKVEQLYNQIPDLADHEIRVGLTRMVSLFKYGHTQIPFGTVAERGVLNVNLYHFEDGIFVEGVQKSDEKALGAKVLKVAGMPVAEALAAIKPVVPAENDSYFKGYGLRFLTVPAVLHAQGVLPNLTEEVTLTLEKEGKTFDYRFKTIPLSEVSRSYGFTNPNEQWVGARNSSETPLFLKQLQERLYFFEYLSDSKTLYVRQSSVFNDEKESLTDFYNRLFEFIDRHEINTFVYDVRLNGGGDNSNNKQLIKGIMARPKINKRGTFFYIMGRNTFSAAQNLTNEVENYTEAILVGEPTAENKNFYGDARGVRLPNSKIVAYLSFAWWQDQGPGNAEEWTTPQMAVAMSFDDYKSNRDVVLEAAINYSETDFMVAPIERLKELFEERNYEEVKKIGKQIAGNSLYHYYDFQGALAAEAFRLLQFGDAEGNIFILELVVECYPESAGALYNLATSLEQHKQLDKAKEAYERLVKLAPDSPLGNSAKKKLAEWNKK